MHAHLRVCICLCRHECMVEKQDMNVYVCESTSFWCGGMHGCVHVCVMKAQYLDVCVHTHVYVDMYEYIHIYVKVYVCIYV